ncbi:hypothetical protein DFJ74DRAFT_666613 [Hyaloraphidium curvatum]|nr:hypothetical protein DFJ74DRAFT_666613 [Hyaloraphidium curvatum]
MAEPPGRAPTPMQINGTASTVVSVPLTPDGLAPHSPPSPLLSPNSALPSPAGSAPPNQNGAPPVPSQLPPPLPLSPVSSVSPFSFAAGSATGTPAPAPDLYRTSTLRRSAITGTAALDQLEKEDAEDSDWTRRIKWLRDLYDILGLPGLLKYDPNNHYKLRQGEIERRARHKEEKTRQREERRKAGERCPWWPWPSNPGGQGRDTPEGDAKDATPTDPDEEDIEYQIVLDLATSGALENRVGIDVHALPDPSDPNYADEMRDVIDRVKHPRRVNICYASCCGAFPVLWPQWRLRLRRTLRDPLYSWLANVWSLFIALTIVVSLAVLVIESVESVTTIPEWREVMQYTSLAVLVTFTAELLLSWLTMKNVLEFFSWSNFVNLVTVIPPAVVVALRFERGTDPTVASVMQKLLVLRVFKLTDLAQRSPRVSLMFTAIQKSWDGILSLVVADLGLMVFFSTVVFYAETTGMILEADGLWYYNEYYGGGVSPFQNIPVTFWFTIVSITTTGYGDMVPRTVAGKICTSVMLILAAALIAFPLAIINANFSALVGAQEAGKQERRERRRMRRAMTRRPTASATAAGNEVKAAEMVLMWHVFGVSEEQCSLRVPRALLARVLGTADVEGTLAKSGWQLTPEGALARPRALVGPETESVQEALRMLLMGKAT